MRSTKSQIQVLQFSGDDLAEKKMTALHSPMVYCISSGCDVLIDHGIMALFLRFSTVFHQTWHGAWLFHEHYTRDVDPN